MEKKTTHLRPTGLVKHLCYDLRQDNHQPGHTEQKNRRHKQVQYPGSKLQQVALLKGHRLKVSDRLQHRGGGRFV